MSNDNYDYGRGGQPIEQTQRINPNFGYDPNQPIGYEQPKEQQYGTPVKPYPGQLPQELPPPPVAPIQPYQPGQYPPQGQQQYPPQYPAQYPPQYPPTQYDAANADAALRQEALKAVKAKEGFRAHLASYLFVIGLNIAIWLIISFTTGHLFYFWPIWIAFGWGIGVFAHYMSVYGGWKEQTAADRQRAVDEEIRRRRRR